MRRDAGMFDVSHMLWSTSSGAGARDFLRRALANNVDKLKGPGKALYSCMLNEEGGVIDDLIVYFLREDCFRMVVNAGTAEKDLAWLDALARALRSAGRSSGRGATWRMIAVQGPQRARELLAGAARRRARRRERLAAVQRGGRSASFIVARTGYTGEDGFEIMLPAAEAASAVAALVAAARGPAASARATRCAWKRA